MLLCDHCLRFQGEGTQLPDAPNPKKVAVKKGTGIPRRAPSRMPEEKGARGRSVTGGGVATRSNTRSGHATGTIGDKQTAARANSTMGKAKASLSLKFTIPVATVVAVVIALLAVFLSRMTTQSLSNEILKSGVSQAAMLATYGRAIILKADQLYQCSDAEFLNAIGEEVPEDAPKVQPGKSAAPSPTQDAVAKNAWPVDLRLVNADEFSKLASEYVPAGPRQEKLNRLTPRSYVNARKTLFAAWRSGLLASFISQISTDEKVIQTQTLVAYIICTDKSLIELYYDEGNVERKDLPKLFLLARSESGSDVKADRPGDLNIRPDNWVPKYVNLREYNNGVTTEAFSSADGTNFNSSNPCSVYAAEIELKGSNYKILTFSMPIFGEDNTRIGDAVLGLRAEEIVTQVSAINTLLWATGAFGVAMAILTCFIVGIWVTRPVKSLIIDMITVASGNLEHKTRAHSNDEIGLIAVEFNEMTKHLLIASKKEKEAARLENELEMACEIQMKLLPPRLPRIKGFDIHAVYHPAKEVGGDYYDFFPIDKRHVGIIVADVSGKGIPGSMVMATTRTILRFVAAGNLSSADTLAKTNAMVAADIKRGMFVTAFYLVLDVLDRTLLCSSAGHNPMIIHHANGEVELINPNGIALGFDKGRIFSRTIKEQHIELLVGDRVVLYTDGVVESMNEKSEEYTDERFYTFVREHSTDNSETFVTELLADLNRHKGKAEQHDDITIVTFRVI